MESTFRNLKRQRVAVVGGGISGLTAAYYLLRKGISVELYEGAPQLGGLAASFDFSGLTIEKYYHFICGGDRSLMRFIRRLGLSDKLSFRPTKTAFFHNGRYYPFGTALDLLRFTPISPMSRIRFGLSIIRSKHSRHWDELDRLSAKDWLCRTMGRPAFGVIWYPLLKVKFGEHHEKISAAWIWHRIHRLAASRQTALSKEKLGYLRGGCQSLISRIEDSIRGLGGIVWLNSEVREITKYRDGFRLRLHTGSQAIFERVVLAVPLPIAARIIENLSPSYARGLSAIRFIGVRCGIFRLRKKVTDAFWLNINDPRIAANGFIEYTNLNPLQEIRPETIVYVPFYVPVEDRWYRLDEDSLRAAFFDMIKTVNPGLSEDDVVGFRVFKSPYAQAICPVGFAHSVPRMETPSAGLFLLDSTQLYPSDRTMSGLIGLAENLVNGYF